MGFIITEAIAPDDTAAAQFMAIRGELSDRFEIMEPGVLIFQLMLKFKTVSGIIFKLFNIED